jgi:hypothetical protein
MPKPTVTIGRDSFARHDIIRETVRTSKTCDWCGNNERGRLFRYGTSPDSIQNRDSWSSGLFCSIGCYRSYHNA